MCARRRFGVTALGAAAALLLAGAAGRAQAGLIVSNLSQTQNAVNDTPFAAQSFTVGAVSQTLASVTLSLENLSLGADQTVTVHLFSDNSGVPGSSLLTIGSLTIPAGSGFADHTLSAPAFTLQANTTFWLEAESGTSGLNVQWALTDSTTTTGPGTLGSWAVATSPPSWTPLSSGRLQLEVDSAQVTGVPEPSGLALLGLGDAGLLGWRARRRAAAGRLAAAA
jgi:hypothetical protein